MVGGHETPPTESALAFDCFNNRGFFTSTRNSDWYKSTSFGITSNFYCARFAFLACHFLTLPKWYTKEKRVLHLPLFHLLLNAFYWRLHCLPKHCFPIWGGCGRDRAKVTRLKFSTKQCLEYCKIFDISCQIKVSQIQNYLFPNRTYAMLTEIVGLWSCCRM